MNDYLKEEWKRLEEKRNELKKYNKSDEYNS